MENNNVLISEDFLVKIKKEPKEEYTGIDYEEEFPIRKEPKEEYTNIDYEEEFPIRSLVLRFVRDRSGTYSVVPLIKPDPFFEEHLEDEFCHEDKYSVVKPDGYEQEEETNDQRDNNIVVKQENIEDDNNNDIATDQKRKRFKRRNVKMHMRFVPNKTNISTCSKCTYSNCVVNVRRHIQRVHPEETLSCPLCNKNGFKEPITIESHILARHMDNRNASSFITRKIFSCDFCSYRSLKICNFRRHLLTHGDNRLKNRLVKSNNVYVNVPIVSKSDHEIKMALKRSSYDCYHCPYSTKDKSSLVKHVRLHKPCNRMPFECTACNWKFNEKNSLDSHIVKHHLDDEDCLKTVTNRVYECELCDYKDVNKNKVIRHKRARHVKKERNRRKTNNSRRRKMIKTLKIKKMDF